jgi:catechol 2,3-dioxygenase-like lactoylglutathione lyase family enzyme
VRQRISLVTLGVADLDRARRFYLALGWRPSPRSVEGEVLFFDAGGTVVALWDRAKLAADSGRRDSGGWGGITLASNVGSAAEVDRVLDEAATAGAVLARRGAATEWGGYSGVFVDPDGHPWEVAHNPDWFLDPDGAVRLD